MLQHGHLTISHSTIVHLNTFQCRIGDIQVQTQGLPVIEFMQEQEDGGDKGLIYMGEGGELIRTCTLYSHQSCTSHNY